MNALRQAGFQLDMPAVTAMIDVSAPARPCVRFVSRPSAPLLVSLP